MNEAERQQFRDELETWARWLDSKFTIPGTKISFGLDSLIGLIPGVGDTISLGLSSWLIARARSAGVSKLAVTRMAGNVAIDWAIGLIPLVGDVFDIGFKANLKNLDIVRKDLDRRSKKRRDEGVIDTTGHSKPL